MSDKPIVYQFVDTNILVYAYDLSAGRKREIAKTLVEQCWENQNGCLSVQVLQEFYVNITQKIPNPLERQTARQLVADLTLWKTHAPSPGDVLAAIDLQREFTLSFWDAMIIQSALQTSCIQIWSEDLSHGQVFRKTQVTNPFIE
jgi:predicted nucleic acid-binding protein